MKIIMTKSRKTRDLPQERAEKLIRMGEAKSLEVEKPRVVPPKPKKKITQREVSPRYDSRQMRVSKRRYKRKAF